MRNKPSKWAAFKALPGALVPTERKRKAGIGKQPESVLQAQAEAYLRLRGLFFVRLPDSLLRVVFSNPQIPIWTKREVSDCVAGLPDLTILKNGRYLACELKRIGGKMSAKQREVQREIGTIQVERFEDFQAVVDSWEKTL